MASGCSKPEFKYPDSKIWAHRVNDIASAKEKSSKFVGMEVDIMFSERQNELYVAHDSIDLSKKLLLQDWFASIENPSTKYYWMDLKNLNSRNAQKVADKINALKKQYDMVDNVFVESNDIKALKVIKHNDIRTILWTENIQWNHLDTATWIDHTRKQIIELKPDAISGEVSMFGLLTSEFPEQNIHIWQTPAEYNEANAELTRKLCSHNSVKVVLVDYDNPIKY